MTQRVITTKLKQPVRRSSSKPIGTWCMFGSYLLLKLGRAACYRQRCQFPRARGSVVHSKIKVLASPSIALKKRMTLLQWVGCDVEITAFFPGIYLDGRDGDPDRDTPHFCSVASGFGPCLVDVCSTLLSAAIAVVRIIGGVDYRVRGMENLPDRNTGGRVILCAKHQSTWETFYFPSMTPYPLAYVFKRELLYIPFFGWALASLDMVHIDRSARGEAWNKVARLGTKLMDTGKWIIMFPEGTRTERRLPGRLQKWCRPTGARDRGLYYSYRSGVGALLAAQVF